MTQEADLRARIAAQSGWIVQRQLGRGQYGTAYVVEKEEDGTSVAVAKVVGLEFLPEKDQQNAYQEVELMRGLRHPHIVCLRDHFVTDGKLELVMVMEFCDSGDLREEVKKRSAQRPVDNIPEKHLMAWFVQITQALNYIHTRHILHRDMKSSNIFLTKSSHGSEIMDTKIGDFGISRVLECTVAVAATVVGTPYYMSPEVCKAEPYGVKSDIWSLGCVLYEMCMLKHAFESASLLGLVYKIVSETYEPIPAQYSNDLTMLLERVLDKSEYSRPNGKDLLADPYVKRFCSRDSTIASEQQGLEPLQRPVLSSGASSPRPSLKQWQAQPAVITPAPFGGNVEPCPVQPVTDAVLADGASVSAATPHDAREVSVTPDVPERREWCAPPFVAPTTLGEEELRARVMFSRMRRALAARRQNWLMVFATYNKMGDGKMKVDEFMHAVTSMALGLSDSEIREVMRFLQGDRDHVPIDAFCAGMQNVPAEVGNLEAWGSSLLLDLAREAVTAQGASGGVAVGATVKVEGLESYAGQKLNGLEGIVESWDAEHCRWYVRLTASNDVKALRHNNLLVLQAPSSAPEASAGLLDTAPLYLMLCQGGSGVSEDRFVDVVRSLLPAVDKTERRRLLLLMPKSAEGQVDVQEVLAQLVSSSADQTMGNGAGPRNQYSPTKRAGPDFGPAGAGLDFKTPVKTNRVNVGSAPSPVPGSVASPRSSLPGGGAFRVPPARGGGSGAGGGEQRGGVKCLNEEVSLMRLAQRLLGGVSVHGGGQAAATGTTTGPGMDALKLFVAKPGEISLEELLDAVSVLPLGIARGEVQGIFSRLTSGLGGTIAPTLARSSSRSSVPFAQLSAAAEAAYNSGVPAEAIDQIDLVRLLPALQRMAAGGAAGRVSLQEFRFAVMRAENCLTHGQLEWLIMLTDKDGEGLLLPYSLLARLGEKTRNVDYFPAPHRASVARRPVAPNTPTPLVMAAIMTRCQERIAAIGPQLSLERLLGLFFAEGMTGTAASTEIRCDVLGAVLGNLRLGMSVSEGEEVAKHLCGTSPGVVQLSSLFDLVRRMTEPESQARVNELREAAKQALLGKGAALAALAQDAASGGEWLVETEFVRCLKEVFSAAALNMGEEQAEDGDIDRLMLIVEKGPTGDGRWRTFLECYAGLPVLESFGDEVVSPWGTASPKRPAGVEKNEKLRAEKNDLGSSQQSWRCAKQVPNRTMVTQLPPPPTEMDPLSPKACNKAGKKTAKCGCTIA